MLQSQLPINALRVIGNDRGATVTGTLALSAGGVMDLGFYLASAVVILGIAFFIIFRQPIVALIARIRTISRTGITTEAPQREATPERDPRAEAEALMRVLDNTLIREVEEGITNELRNRNLLGAEAVPVLVRYLAGMQIAFGFEEVYRLIWGSQLSLLHYLNTRVDGDPVEAVRPFYTLAASQYPDAYNGYSFEAWLGFLRDQVLVREDAGRLRITVRGREFLTYLTRMGRSLNKAG